MDETYNVPTTEMHISEEERRKYLQKLQEQTTLAIIPAMIALILMAVVGIIGNSLVLYVYSRKFILNGTRVFILVIAAFDLVTNVIVIPGEVHGMFHTWDFDQPWVCRVRRYTNALTTGVSAQMLVALAVVRYRKVCVPFGWQISARQAKTISCVLIATSVLFSIPYGLINGTLTRPTPRPGIFGHECSVDDSYVETIWPLTNNALFFFLFLACCSTIVVLYYLVGTKTLRHSRAMGRSAFSCATDGPSSSDGAIVTSSTFTTNMAASDTSNRDSPDATSRIMVEGPLKSIRNRLSKSSKTDNFSLIKNFRGYFTLCANSEGCQKFDEDGNTDDGDLRECLPNQGNKEKRAENTEAVESLYSTIDREVNVFTTRDLTVSERKCSDIIEPFGDSQERRNRTSLKILGNEDDKDIGKDKSLHNPTLARLSEDTKKTITKTVQFQIAKGNIESDRARFVGEIHNQTPHEKENGEANCFSMKSFVSEGLHDIHANLSETSGVHEEDGYNGATNYNEMHIVTDPDNNSMILTSISTEKTIGINDIEIEYEDVDGQEESISKFDRTSQFMDITYCLQREEVEDGDSQTKQSELKKRVPVTSNLFDLSRQQPAGNNKALVVNRRYDQNSSNIAKTKNKALKKNGFASTLKGLTRQDSICERPKVNEPGTKRNLNRTSVMLTTISAIFIVSFIPFLTLAFYFNAHPNAYLALSGTSLSLYHLFVRSYFLNCAANAVIYGIYDLTFRRKCISAIYEVLKKIRS